MQPDPDRPQISTDGLKAYARPADEAFGADVDFAQIIKSYGRDGSADAPKYSPGKCTGMEKIVVWGLPNPDTRIPHAWSGTTCRCGWGCAGSPA